MSTLVVIERPESPGARTADEELSRTRRFRAYHPTGLSFTIPQALAHPSMPKRGDRHPEDPNQRATDYEAFTVPEAPESSYVYDVIWTYEHRSLFDPGDSDEEDDPLTFREEGAAANSIWVDTWRVAKPSDDDEVWRALAPVPLGPNGEWLTEAQFDPATQYNGDIGGMAIDSRGLAVSTAVRISTYTLKVLITNPAVLIPVWFPLIGTRNDALFAGINTGYLLYEGYNITRRDPDLWEVTHQFALDSLAHARQQVWIDATNKPQIGSAANAAGGTITPRSGTGYSTAYDNVGYPVRWVQPYPAVSNFSILQIPF